jgi:integrase
VSVYKTDKSPYWQYDFQRKKQRFHGSTGCTSKRDAEAFEARLKREVALGHEAKRPITLDAACQAYWKDKGQHESSSTTTDYQLANLCEGIGANRLLSSIGTEDFRRYIAKRRATVSNASVNREWQLARRVWKHAAAAGYDLPIPGTPDAIDWSKLRLDEPKERVRELTADEEKRLFEKLPESLKPVVEFAALSGQRRSAVIGLLWDKVDLSGPRATIGLKGGGEHTFPLTPRLVEIIEAQPVVEDCPFVFTYACERPSPPRKDRPRRYKGQRYPFSKQGWMRKWRKALADAKITNFRFHDLRHTRGTRILRSTGNLKTVQKLLGHTDIATTARYAHALEDDIRDAMLAGESRNSTGQALTKKRQSRRKASETEQ